MATTLIVSRKIFFEKTVDIQTQVCYNKNTKGGEIIADQEKPKRKTHTSSEVKNRYNKKTYTRIAFSLHKEKAKAYKSKCREKNIPYSEPLHKAVDDFLKGK